MNKYIDSEKLLAEIERLSSLIPYENNDRHDEGLHDAYKAVKNIIDSLQQEAEEEQRKRNNEMRKASIKYRDSVIKHIEAKRALPSFKGQLLHDFKNELNTMNQILNIRGWSEIQYAIFEKVALNFAAWGGYHFHPGQSQTEDSLEQEQPKFNVGDLVVSKKNPHLTYKILATNITNELGKTDYKVEIFTDGKPGLLSEPHNIHLISSDKIEDWGKLVQQEQPEVDLVAELKHHLATTPKEQLEKEWKELEPWGNIGPTVQEFLYGKQPDNEDTDKVAQELYEHLYELKRRNNVPTNLYDKKEIIELWKAGIEYGRNHPNKEQPEVDLEKAARYVYESWKGGTMDDVRRDMVELGKVLNARKEE